MSLASAILEVLQGELFQLPYFVLFLAAMGVAIRRRDRHPRASLLAIWGCGLQVLANLGGMAKRVWMLSTQGPVPGHLGAYTAVSLAGAVVYLAGWIFILLAVFADRPE